MERASNIIVADACFLLNLLASERIREIMQVLCVSFIIVPHVKKETLFLLGPLDSEGESTRTRIDLTPFETRGEIRVEPTDDDAWRVRFVQCAEFLQDADAASLAMAAKLGVPLASDDAKVRRVAKKLFPEIELWTTLGTLRKAADARSWEDDVVQPLLQNLRRRGNFAAPRNDPDREWYESVLRRATR